MQTEGGEEEKMRESVVRTWGWRKAGLWATFSRTLSKQVSHGEFNYVLKAGKHEVPEVPGTKTKSLPNPLECKSHLQPNRLH